MNDAHWRLGEQIARNFLNNHSLLEGDFPPVGSHVLVEGAVVVVDRRQMVLAARVTVLGEPTESSGAGDATQGTHASPTEHERRGHWRTLGRGTERERLVWVRSTTVNPALD